MKNKSGRIPTTISLFNDYINNTEVYLRTNLNSERLGMIPSEMDAWTNFKNEWNALYQKYSDKEASRTTVITNKLHDVQGNFRTFAQRLLNMMAGIRSATEDDAAVLNFVLTRAEPSRSNTPIDGIPTFSASPIGGGVVKFSVRPAKDSARASILEEASGIEIRYEIGEASGTTSNNYTFFTSTRSIFNLTLPENSRGKTMSVSARWIVANDQGLSGPWSNVLRVVIA